MLEIAKFFSQYSLWIYLGLIIIFITGIRNLISILSEKRSLVFGLEKELTQRRINRTLTLITLIALIIIGEFILVTFLIPNLPSATQLMTQTIDSRIVPQIPQSQGTMGMVSPSQAALNPNSENCILGQIMITEPVSGMEIQSEIVLTGTANIPNFGFYKYEYVAVGDENWTTILAGRTPVIDGDLGNWDVTELTPGDYRLRLVVFDNINTEYPACSITVKVSN